MAPDDMSGYGKGEDSSKGGEESGANDVRMRYAIEVDDLVAVVKSESPDHHL